MIKLKEPVRFAAVIVGAAFCWVMGGWPVGVAYLVGSFVGSFKIND